MQAQMKVISAFHSLTQAWHLPHATRMAHTHMPHIWHMPHTWGRVAQLAGIALW